MKKLSAFVSAALLAVGGAALAQDQPRPTDRPGEKVTPDRPLPESTADKPDSTMPSQSPTADHDRMGTKADPSMKETTAGSDKAKTGVSYPSRTSEINKHIAFVDLYIDQAVSHAKALTALGDAEPGKKDTALIQEGRKGLDNSIEKALTHLKQVRTFKSDLAMAAPGHDASSTPSVGAKGGGDKLAKLDELERHLKEAKAASKKLASVKLDGLSSSVDGVATHLIAARSTFKDIAKWTSYTLLEDSDLATVPVSGQDDVAPAGEVDRDLGTGTGTGTMGTGSAPGATQPDTATTPSDLDKPADTSAPKSGTSDSERDKGNTIPGSSRPEPTKPAPGGY
jgi:hypothetical protein